MSAIPPFYVACYGGFLCVERYYPAPGAKGRTDQDGTITKTYTVADVRLATSWTDFEDADAMAKWAMGRMYPPDLRYFAILAPTFGNSDLEDNDDDG